MLGIPALKQTFSAVTEEMDDSLNFMITLPYFNT